MAERKETVSLSLRQYRKAPDIGGFFVSAVTRLKAASGAAYSHPRRVVLRGRTRRDGSGRSDETEDLEQHDAAERHAHEPQDDALLHVGSPRNRGFSLVRRG